MLEGYSLELVDQLVSVVAASTVIAYSLYTFTARDSKALMVTIPFVVFGVFRYLLLVHRDDLGEEPEQVLLTDVPILVDVAALGRDRGAHPRTDLKRADPPDAGARGRRDCSGSALYADFGLLDELGGFRWELFPLALALTALNYLIRFGRWEIYLGASSGSTCRAAGASRSSSPGLTMTITPGEGRRGAQVRAPAPVVRRAGRAARRRSCSPSGSRTRRASSSSR